MSTTTINGRSRVAPRRSAMRCWSTSARPARPDRHQARLRRRRLRRLHGAARRRAGRELPDAGQGGRGQAVTTVEGIGAPTLHPVQRAFMAHDALQCGFCTPGFIVEAAAFHDHWRATKGTATPSREEIGAALSGHLCRCGAYDNIFRAVADACAGRFDGERAGAPRVEARAKVTGAANYTVDIRHDGQLEGVILRSPRRARPHHRARSRAGARAARRRRRRVAARRGPVVRFRRRADRRGRGVDRKTAQAALAAIRSTTKPLPAAIGLDAARKADAPVVFYRAKQERRQRRGGRRRAGAVEAAICAGPSAAFSQKAKKARAAGSPMRARRAIRCWSKARSAPATQQHTCLEPHAAVARFDGDEFTVHVSTQAVFQLKELIAKRFKLDHAQGARDRRPRRRRLRLQGQRSAWRPSRRSSSRAPRRRRCASPSTATRSCRSPAIGRPRR